MDPLQIEQAFAWLSLLWLWVVLLVVGATAFRVIRYCLETWERHRDQFLNSPRGRRER